MKTIICATDLLESGERAEALAVAAARRLGTDGVELVHVVSGDACVPPDLDPSVLPAANAMVERLHQCWRDAEQRLQMHVAAIATKVQAKGALRIGRPSEAILELAKDQKPQLVVIGPHAANDSDSLLTKIRNRFFGSTARRIVRHAEISVLVSSGESPDFDHWDGNLTVLACVDFSEGGQKALEAAQRFVAGNGKVVVVHAIAEPVLPPESAFDWPRLRDDTLNAVQRELDKLSPTDRFVDFGSLSNVLEAAVKKHSADLICVGAHAGGAPRLLGSNAERVVENALVPVFVAR